MHPGAPERPEQHHRSPGAPGVQLLPGRRRGTRTPPSTGTSPREDRSRIPYGRPPPRYDRPGVREHGIGSTSLPVPATRPPGTDKFVRRCRRVDQVHPPGAPWRTRAPRRSSPTCSTCSAATYSPGGTEARRGVRWGRQGYVQRRGTPPRRPPRHRRRGERSPRRSSRRVPCPRYIPGTASRPPPPPYRSRRTPPPGCTGGAARRAPRALPRGTRPRRRSG